MTANRQAVQEHEDTQEQESPPEAFVERAKQALEHLYDLSYLQNHPLAQEGGSAAEHSTEIAGQRLRRQLAAAIESLSPEAGVPFRAPHARPYNLLRLRYVQGMTVQEAARELSISLRQAYRDLRHGEKCVAVVLWARRSAPSPQEPSAAQLSSFQAEMAQLETRPRSTDIGSLLQRAQEAVERLAWQRAVRFHAEVPQEPLIISVDPVVARQVLVNVLSQAVQQARPGTLHLALTPSGGRGARVSECLCAKERDRTESRPAEEEQASLTLRYDLEPEATDAPAINLVVAQLVDRLGWRVGQEDYPLGTRVVFLHMIAHGPTVLVIDDNAGLVNLLERYLSDQACRVVAAANGQRGLQLAQELVPDAIVLDVMMPEMDGWELLQRLRTRPQMADIPVIICSVINNPELAYSLGASLFLSKPVSRDDVLTALRQVGVV